MWAVTLALATVLAAQPAAAKESLSAETVRGTLATALWFAQAEPTPPKQRPQRKARKKPKTPAKPAVAQPAPVAPAKPLVNPAPASKPATPKPVAPKPVAPKPVAAPAKPMSPRETYAAMTNAERIAIQSDLMWTGYYDGIVDGDIGDRSIVAVRNYQKRSNAKDTGILNPQERAQLAALAKSQQDQAGWRLVTDTATGVRLGVPAKLVPQAIRGKDGTRWSSASGDIQIETFRVSDPDTTLGSVAAKQRTEADRKVDYDVQRPEFFVLSGDQGPKKFYVRAHGRGEEVRGVTVVYDPAKQELMRTIVVAISNAFVPFSGNSAVAAGNATRRKVEYSTGLVVSATGDVLAGRDATNGCHVIRIAGLGPAERMADEARTGLALLRVRGAGGLHVAPLAGAVSSGNAVTLIGIADPRAQDGGDAVTTPAARLTGDGAALEPAPSAAFSGAAAIGQDNRLRGIVLVKPQAVAGPAAAADQVRLVPADAAVRFVRANKVTPASGTATVANMKPATVRVICVRP